MTVHRITSALAFVAAFVLAVPAYALEQCAEGQHPWKLLYQGTYDLTTGLTPQQACQSWAAANNGWSFVSIVDNVCLITSPSYGDDTAQAVPVCESGSGPAPDPGSPAQVRIDAVNGHLQLTVGVGTQTIVVTPEPVSDERIADMGELFMLFLFAGLVVFCSRSLYDLVRSDTVRD